MESFLFALGAVSPIIIMVALGYVLKKIGIIPVSLTKPLNKIVFKVLLPVMLFLNVYKIDITAEFKPHYLIYSAVAILVVFALSFVLAKVFTDVRSRRGALAQCAYRSNYALIGIPLAESLFGAEGAIIATVLSAVSIPLFNICAVVSLSVFDEKESHFNFKKILLGIVKNPLIIAISLGLVTLGIRAILINNDVAFRLLDFKPLEKVLKYLSGAATPLALLSLGAGFEFATVKAMKKEIILGTLTRVLFVPAVALSVAYLCFPVFEGAHYAAFVGLFCTPVAVSSVPMAQEMGADAELAGQLVIWTTLSSAFTIFLFSFILKALGIF